MVTPRYEIVLGWVKFLPLNFHPYPSEADIFNQPCGELALEGDKVQAGFSAPICSLKRGSSLWDSSNSRDASFSFTHRIKPTRR
jgi:hypothetical protein